MQDLCLSARLFNGLPRATITRLNAATGTFTVYGCDTSDISPALVLGEMVQIREPNGPKTFLPAHY